MYVSAFITRKKTSSTHARTHLYHTFSMLIPHQNREMRYFAQLLFVQLVYKYKHWKECDFRVYSETHSMSFFYFVIFEIFFTSNIEKWLFLNESWYNSRTWTPPHQAKIKTKKNLLFRTLFSYVYFISTDCCCCCQNLELAHGIVRKACKTKRQNKKKGNKKTNLRFS